MSDRPRLIEAAKTGRRCGSVFDTADLGTGLRPAAGQVQDDSAEIRDRVVEVAQLVPPRGFWPPLLEHYGVVSGRLSFYLHCNNGFTAGPNLPT